MDVSEAKRLKQVKEEGLRAGSVDGLPKQRGVGVASNKTVIVTGASQGIGATVVQAFLGRGYNVVATSRSVSKAGFASSPNLAFVDGEAATAAKIAQTAIRKFGSIDSLVNNAGAFLVKPFTDYTAEDLRGLVSTNLEGFFFITQLAVKQMLSQGSGGSVTSLTASLASTPSLVFRLRFRCSPRAG
jgi:NAD(P)-dependent dehydrogenase (short-subunit alcohol dehydrogenase family)